MKLFLLTVWASITFMVFSASARELTGIEAQKVIPGTQKVLIPENSSIPQFVLFQPGSEIPFDQFETWSSRYLHLPAGIGFTLLNSESDKTGMTHYRYAQTINGIPVQGSMYLVHVRNQSIVSVNGQLFDRIDAGTAVSISEKTALDHALMHMNAKQYRWQISSWEQHLKEVTKNPAATWYPKGELMYAPRDGKYNTEKFRLCYRFDVYAQEPLAREYVFVDAETGDVIYKINRIHNTDVPATVVTAYSGLHTMTTDSVNATTYRLQNTSRGLGVETYNLQQSTNYVNTDFIDTDNYWDNVNAQLDQYAGDAHWGAETTYDFYYLHFNRNSLDNAGQKLISYVHYDVGFVNAFWDGVSMTYGDGGGSYTPLTSLEITGHEISHGITENTCNLVYADESGAMNEGFSDCMGNAIRYFGKQSPSIDWLIGNEIGGTPFRNMANPNQYQNPDCYNGTYWNAPNEVHNNSGVLNFWFYLLTEGGTGTNDLNNVYSVSPLGIDTAAAILYHAWATYMFPNATYADARYYTIQSAADLYGACTDAVIQTTNAWHAVGVGNTFIFGTTSNFNAPLTDFCEVPSTVNFINTSNNGGTYQWDFGDGTTSTLTSPAHIYNAFGVYDVTLIADGGACGSDTITKLAYINIDPANPCIVILTNGQNQTQTACAGFLYDTGGPNSNYGDNSNSTITIAPLGSSTVTLNFTLFELEDNYDYLTIYDGPSTASPLIGAYTGFTLPNGGTISSTGSSITLVQTSDINLNYAGFAINWQCQLSNVPPTANFTANVTSSCTGTINFVDLSQNGPTSWLWDFGDGNTSPFQHPSHTYTASGVYTVTLTATNGFGSDVFVQPSYITINLPVAPLSADTSICPGTSASLNAIGADSLFWYTAPTGGAPVFTGSGYTTPALNATTTYYVESSIFPAQQYVGPLDNTIGGGNNYIVTTYRCEIFDCLSPVRLVSVKVFAVGAGIRTITLTDGGGNVINTVNANIPDGTSRVTLNFDLLPGTNYELGIPGGNANLYRNNSGAVYPYFLAGLVSITGSNAGAPGYFYYFYDWELQEAPCTSLRTPVTVNVAPILADFSYTTVMATYTFTDNSTGGAVSWQWDFGDGVVSTLQNPVHTYTANGVYNVMLVVGDGTCTDTLYQAINVVSVGIAQNEIAGGVSLFPNPVHDKLLLQISQAVADRKYQVKLNDMLGRTILIEEVPGQELTSTHSMDLSALAPGIYEIVIGDEGRTFVQKIVKQ